MNDYQPRFDYFVNGEGMYEWELDSLFKEYIDEIFPPYEMGVLIFYPSSILECDPVAYRTVYNEWLDNEMSEGNIVENES